MGGKNLTEQTFEILSCRVSCVAFYIYFVFLEDKIRSRKFFLVTQLSCSHDNLLLL